MLKAFSQIGLLGGLVVCLSIVEAALPLMVPTVKPIDRFRHSTHLEGTLAGWKACLRDGRQNHPGRSRAYLEAFCSSAYARRQMVQVSLTNLTRHTALTCVKDDKAYARGFSATLSNHSDTVQVARLAVEARLAGGSATSLTANLPIQLRPGETRHQCLGIQEEFDTAADAAAFDKLTRDLEIHITGIYGMKKGDPKQVATPSPFLLSSNR